jgi:hypothetical protein
MYVFFSGTRHQTPQSTSVLKINIAFPPTLKTATSKRTSNSKRVSLFFLYPDRFPSHNNPCELVAMSSIIARVGPLSGPIGLLRASRSSSPTALRQRRMKERKGSLGDKSTDIKKERKKEQASKKRGPKNSISFLPSYHGAPVN